ncbi:hypothetical protein [Micromonospora sp. NPDC049891]|uniref:hypothetical protein n=1 Tax=Micromonospora sp. NPDC049891 TaxID=3155655 RepID=UPI0033F84072
MGIDILLAIWVVTWMVKTAAQDVAYAVTGKPNPRYQVKLERARKAGGPTPQQHRYGTRDWLSDLYSDALAAHTEKRRKKAAVKGQPVDDMLDHAGVTPQQQRPAVASPGRRRPAPEPTSVVHDDEHPYCVDPCGPDCARPTATNAWWRCPRCGERKGGFRDADAAQADSQNHVCPAQPTTPDSPAATPDTNTEPSGEQPKLATVIPMFPIMKESDMANAEITGLPTAIAFAEGMANAHRAASTAGGEQYVAALRGFEVSGEAIGAVERAREQSQAAAAAWTAAAAEMKKQNTVKEAYQAVPDAGNKKFVTGE